MKKIISLAILTFLFSFSSTNIVSAQIPVTVTSDIGFPTALVDLAKDAWTAVSSASSAISEYSLVTKFTILDPIGNKLVNIAIQQSSNQILNWAKGGFQGQPLIISNPEQYIKNQGLNYVKANLSTIPTNSIYGGSILDSVVKNYKNGDIGTQLKSLSQSSIPKITQDNFCADSYLSQMAKNDVSNSDGSYSNNEYKARKKELYDAYCVLDSSDPRLAKKLLLLNEQTNTNGLDGILLASSPKENETSKAMRASAIISQEEEKKAKLAERDIYDGQGVASEKTCVSSQSVDENGDPYASPDEAPCLEYAVDTPGDLGQAELEKATTASLDRQISSQNQGGGILGILGALADGFTKLLTTKGLAAVFGSNSKPISSPINKVNITGPSTQVKQNTDTVKTNNIITDQIKTPIFQNDLVNDEAGRESLLTPIKAQVKFNLNQLNNLKTTDLNYLSAVRSYKAQLETVRNCYESIGTSTNGGISSALSFYNAKMEVSNNLENTLEAELSAIEKIKSLGGETVAKFESSKSTAEILYLFNNYQNSTDSAGVSSPSISGQRDGELIQYTTLNSQDTTISTLNTQCERIKQDSRTGSSGGSE